VGLGRGRTDFGWKWNPTASAHLSTPLYFVPYSHILPRCRTLFNLFTEEQHAVFSDLLGGIYTTPSDQRLSLSFEVFELQQQNWDSAMKTVSKFLSFMEILRDFGGSFTTRDYDDSPDGKDVSDIFPGVALYGYKGCVLKATA
jgi:hypothetical protein